LQILKDGSTRKFVREVEHRTFSGELAQARGQPVLYFTERCVFSLTGAGLELSEIAPGIDLEHDILAQMDFVPIMSAPPKLMDARLFRPELMQLRAEMLSLPADKRFVHDAAQGLFFANFQGLTVRNSADVESIRAQLEPILAALGRRVPAIVDYDNFTVLPDALDEYVAMAHDLAERYYSRVSRYSTSAFTRSRLGWALEGRGAAPHIFGSAEEARRHLGTDD
jgi:propionate CoA-transferase